MSWFLEEDAMAAKKKLATLQVRYVARLSAAKIFGKVMINKYIYMC